MRPGKRRLQPADGLLNPRGSSTEWAVAAALEPLDKVAIETEARWGIGVLERLAPPDVAARFASARKKLDEAIEAQPCQWEDVAKRAAVMIRGWSALEQSVIAAGHEPKDIARYWAVEAETGTRFMFVQQERDMQAAIEAHPDHQVWAMSEVVRVMVSHSLEATFASKVKEQFPGAVLKAIRSPSVAHSDPLPF